MSMMQNKLRQGSWWGTTESIALNSAAAVSRGAVKLSVFISASRPSPNSAGPVSGGCREGAVGE